MAALYRGLFSTAHWYRLAPAVLSVAQQPAASSITHSIIPWQRSQSTSTSTETSQSEELVPERLYTKVNVKIKGADYAVLDSYCRFVITAGKALDIDTGGRVALPTRIQKFTLLKSPHIFKKHRVQYEIRTHARLMQVKKITGTTADIFLEYIQRNLPEGVSMSVTQWELEKLPQLLLTPPDGAEQKNEKKKKQR